MQILLADAQPQVRSALRLLLEHEPEVSVVGEVTDAKDLLNSVRVTRPDLLLLDWDLPGLTDSNLLPVLRQGCPHLSIIALSGYIETRQRALSAGVEGFISKSHPPQDLLMTLRQVRKRHQKKRAQVVVEDWMTSDVVTLSTQANALEAYRLMTKYHIRRLPIVENDHLVGIVTLGDIRRRKPSSVGSPDLPEINRHLSCLNIKEVMTPQPITTSQSMPIAQAATLMLERKISGLPVVNEQHDMVGIITESDIFRMIVQSWRSGQNLAI
ncbi:MAG: CBS domain-containing protein [Anaerolineae bacterium]|nr:CBS domain-containing protein [Anaerolineae bacterium]